MTSKTLLDEGLKLLQLLKEMPTRLQPLTSMSAPLREKLSPHHPVVEAHARHILFREETRIRATTIAATSSRSTMQTGSASSTRRMTQQLTPIRSKSTLRGDLCVSADKRERGFGPSPHFFSPQWAEQGAPVPVLHGVRSAVRTQRNIGEEHANQ